MFTLWPEPVELPEDRTNTPMYKMEIFDSPENAKFAFEQACKDNKFPFVYLKPVNQPLETDNTPLTNDEDTELLEKPKEVSIPSFTMAGGASLEEKDRPLFSITKEQDDKAETWWKKHYKKYHSKKHKALCAGMESEFVYEWHFTNIGPYCIGVCKDCEKLYREQKEKAKNILKQYNENKSKKLLKEYEKADKLASQLYKQATITIREIDE